MDKTYNKRENVENIQQDRKCRKHTTKQKVYKSYNETGSVKTHNKTESGKKTYSKTESAQNTQQKRKCTKHYKIERAQNTQQNRKCTKNTVKQEMYKTPTEQKVQLIQFSSPCYL